MASILTPKDVVRRIAAECTFVDERGAVGICLNPAAAMAPQWSIRRQLRGQCVPYPNRCPVKSP